MQSSTTGALFLYVCRVSTLWNMHNYWSSFYPKVTSQILVVYRPCYILYWSQCSKPASGQKLGEKAFVEVIDVSSDDEL